MDAWHAGLRAPGQTHAEFVATVMSVGVCTMDCAGIVEYRIDAFQKEFREEMDRWVFRCPPAFWDIWTA